MQLENWSDHFCSREHWNNVLKFSRPNSQTKKASPIWCVLRFLENPGDEVRKNTLETSGEDVITTLETSGEDVITTLETSVFFRTRVRIILSFSPVCGNSNSPISITQFARI